MSDKEQEDVPEMINLENTAPRNPKHRDNKPKKEKKYVPPKKIKISSKGMMVALTVFLMFSSVLTVWLFNPDSSIDYDDPHSTTDLAAGGFQVSGFSFYDVGDGTFGSYLPTSTGQLWPIRFRLDPREAEHIGVDSAAVAKIKSSNKIYLSYNPNEEEIPKVSIAAIEISRVIPLITGLSITEAYTEDSDPISPDIPLKTCEDATESAAVIQLEVADTNEFVREGDCVIVRGTDADNLILSADKFGMHLVGLTID